MNVSSHSRRRRGLAAGLLHLILAALTCGWASSAAWGAQNETKEKPAAAGLVPLLLNLPNAPFRGTPTDVPVGPNVEPFSTNARPPMLVPGGLKNIAPAAKLSCSDTNAAPDQLAKVTDGQKEDSDDNILFLRKGLQYVQMDFGREHEVFAIVIWHAFNRWKVYQDVIVQAADDPQFTVNVRTLFNNDLAGACGRGLGHDREYWESEQGKLIDAKGTRTRFLRFYSKGSTDSVLNEYTEIEVYGRPAR
jgi:hypothetical protein